MTAQPWPSQQSSVQLSVPGLWPVASVTQSVTSTTTCVDHVYPSVQTSARELWRQVSVTQVVPGIMTSVGCVSHLRHHPSVRPGVQLPSHQVSVTPAVTSMPACVDRVYQHVHRGVRMPSVLASVTPLVISILISVASVSLSTLHLHHPDLPHHPPHHHHLSALPSVRMLSELDNVTLLVPSTMTSVAHVYKSVHQDVRMP